MFFLATDNTMDTITFSEAMETPDEFMVKIVLTENNFNPLLFFSFRTPSHSAKLFAVDKD